MHADTATLPDTRRPDSGHSDTGHSDTGHTALRRTLHHARKSVGDHLRDALQHLACGQARFASHEERAWASATFSGTRHRLDLLFDGAEAVEAGEDFIADLPDHEFAIRDQLVADVAVIEVDHRMLPAPRLAVSVELLLLDEA